MRAFDLDRYTSHLTGNQLFPSFSLAHDGYWFLLWMIVYTHTWLGSCVSISKMHPIKPYICFESYNPFNYLNKSHNIKYICGEIKGAFVWSFYITYGLKYFLFKLILK